MADNQRAKQPGESSVFSLAKAVSYRNRQPSAGNINVKRKRISWQHQYAKIMKRKRVMK
jgi:hypothetical protein